MNALKRNVYKLKKHINVVQRAKRATFITSDQKIEEKRWSKKIEPQNYVKASKYQELLEKFQKLSKNNPKHRAAAADLPKSDDQRVS
jgi:hypothetical protein